MCPGCDVVCLTSVSCVTVVASRAVSFEVLVSPPPDTATVFVIEAAAELLTFTVRVSSEELTPALQAPTHLECTLPLVQDHPVPAIAVAVSPEGNVSVTVTVPDVAPLPLLFTVIDRKSVV